MRYKNFLYLISISFFLYNCSTYTVNENSINLYQRYDNNGFTLIYTDQLFKNKVVSKKIDKRSLIIFQKNLKKNTKVKITNNLNNKYIIAKVGSNALYPSFNNSVISPRIAKELEINIFEPFIKITTINIDSVFVAKKAKTYDEEKQVANKAPVNIVNINDLNIQKIKKEKIIRDQFKYIIKIADFYFNESALLLVERIKNETTITDIKVKRLSKTKYRVLLGPFIDISSLQDAFNDINILGFENIEITKNDKIS